MKLRELAKTASTTAHFGRAVAAALGLGASTRNRLGDAAPCAPRPNLAGAGNELAAVVLAKEPLVAFSTSKERGPGAPPPAVSLLRARAAAGRLALARELGLLESKRPPTEGVVSLDGGAGFGASMVDGLTKGARLQIAHAAACALETGRAFRPPALHLGERAFFPWTFLDVKSLEDVGVAWLPTRVDAVPRNASLIAVDEWTARLATDDPRDPRVTAFALPKGATPGRAALDLAQLHRPELVLLHLPFLRRNGGAAKSAPLALAVLKELRWCPDHLVGAARDARRATAAASCWGRGVVMDE